MDKKKEDTSYITLIAEFEDFDETEIRLKYQFCKPGKAKIQRCQKDMVRAADKAFRTLVIDCIHPDEREAFLADIEQYPGLPTTFGNEILRRTGFDSLGK